MITIENEHVSASFNEVGAELCSLINRKTNVEHMWRADPKFWGRSAPILFPCVGESNNGEIRVEGNSYKVSRHGFVRTMAFEAVHSSADQVTFCLVSNEETLTKYPFKFELRINYRLEGSTLHQTMIVINENKSEMVFQIGGHPAFAVPFAGGEYTDYQIEFPEKVTVDRHLLTETGTYSGLTQPVLSNSELLTLNHQLFYEDAIVFKDFPLRSASLIHKESKTGLRVDFQGFHHFGLWAAKDADFVCIEPWIGCADDHDFQGDFFEKDSVVKLDSKAEFDCGFSITAI
ncbi:MAG: galactose mutarotase-like enzyme [Bacteroidia bacterium]|jgi:galactose mutarotase-like enzyme